MKTWHCLFLGFACLAWIAGCRADPRLLALERENRNLENTIYELQDTLDQTQSQLDGYRQDSVDATRSTRARQRRADDAAIERSDPSEDALPGRRSTLRESSAASKKKKQSPLGSEDVGLPDIQVGTEPLPPGEVPSTIRRPSAASVEPARSGNAAPRKNRDELPEAPKANGSPQLGPPTDRPRANEPGQLRVPGNTRNIRGESYRDRSGMGRSGVVQTSVVAVEPVADSAFVDHIALHPRYTGGFEADGRPGHDGIAVLIGPRDLENRPVPAAAPVSVVLVDRAMPDGAARVARWDFSGKEAAQHYRRSAKGEGIYLKMPWSAAPPTHGQLDLFVRYMTRDGRKLEAHQEIQILPPIAAANQVVMRSTSPGREVRRVGMPLSRSIAARQESEPNAPDELSPDDSGEPSPSGLTVLASRPALLPVSRRGEPEASQSAGERPIHVAHTGEAPQGPILGDASGNAARRSASSETARSAAVKATEAVDGEPATPSSDASVGRVAMASAREFRAGGDDGLPQRAKPVWGPNRQ
jgi:hypothetical protein